MMGAVAPLPMMELFDKGVQLRMGRPHGMFQTKADGCVKVVLQP